MKYTGMPAGMWMLFRRSFREHLVSVLGFGEGEAKRVPAAARQKYRQIIAKLPEFEKADRFKMNIVSCAMLSAFVLSMGTKPSVYVPAMCHLDYTMAEAGNACDFVRAYTLASGGPYCDCGYRIKGRA